MSGKIREFGTEYWKTISTHKKYEISSFGKVRRKARLLYCGHKQSNPQQLKRKILKSFISFGYKRIRLYTNQTYKDYSVHRLVAEAFISNLQNKPEVNHKDGNKLNNNVKNLEWVTRSENQKHSFKLGLNKTVLINGKNTRFKKGHIPWNKGVKTYEK